MALIPVRHRRPSGQSQTQLQREQQNPSTLVDSQRSPLLALPAPAAQLYVAPNGSDTNPGTRARPFATLERARDEARRLKQDGKLPKGGLTIWLRGGDYLRTNALQAYRR